MTILNGQSIGGTTRALRAVAVVGLLGIGGCLGGEESHESNAAVSADVGTPSGTSVLEFVPLRDNDAIFLETFGQGGTHALLAVRCSGFGERAFITIWMTSLLTGQRASLTTPTAQPLACDDEGLDCDLMPILMMTGAFGEPETLEGLDVEAGGECRGERGEKAETRRRAVLSTALLDEE